MIVFSSLLHSIHRRRIVRMEQSEVEDRSMGNRIEFSARENSMDSGFASYRRNKVIL